MALDSRTKTMIVASITAAAMVVAALVIWKQVFFGNKPAPEPAAVAKQAQPAGQGDQAKGMAAPSAQPAPQGASNAPGAPAQGEKTLEQIFSEKKPVTQADVDGPAPSGTAVSQPPAQGSTVTPGERIPVTAVKPPPSAEPDYQPAEATPTAQAVPDAKAAALQALDAKTVPDAKPSPDTVPKAAAQPGAKPDAKTAASPQPQAQAPAQPSAQLSPQPTPQPPAQPKVEADSDNPERSALETALEREALGLPPEGGVTPAKAKGKEAKQPAKGKSEEKPAVVKPESKAEPPKPEAKTAQTKPAAEPEPVKAAEPAKTKENAAKSHKPAPASAEAANGTAKPQAKAETAKSAPESKAKTAAHPAWKGHAVFETASVSSAGNATVVRLKTTAVPPSETVTLVDSPARVIVDLPGDWDHAGPGQVAGSGLVRKVRIGKHADKLRIVLDLTVDSTSLLADKPTVAPNGGGIAITLKK